MDSIFIFIAKYLIYILIFGAVIWFLLLKNKKNIFYLGLGVTIISFILSRVASMVYENSRPFVVSGIKPLIDHEANNGFPSDHMLLATVIALVVTTQNKKLGVVFWVGALLIGYSRIYVGVHHFIDILGSLIIVLFSYFVVNYFLKKKGVIINQ